MTDDTAKHRYDRFEQLLAEAAESLRLPIEHVDVRLLAGLRLRHETMVEKLIAGGNVDTGELIAMSQQIKQLMPPLPPRQVDINIVSVETVEIECKSCKAKHTYVVSNKDADDGSVAREVATPSAPPPPAPPAPPPEVAAARPMPAPNRAGALDTRPASQQPISPTMREWNRQHGYSLAPDGQLGRNNPVRRRDPNPLGNVLAEPNPMHKAEKGHPSPECFK